MGVFDDELGTQAMMNQVKANPYNPETDTLSTQETASTFQAGIDSAYRTYTVQGRVQSRDEIFAERESRIREVLKKHGTEEQFKLGNEIPNKLFAFLGTEDLAKPAFERSDEEIQQLREKYPELENVKTDSELMEEFKQRELQRQKEVALRLQQGSGSDVAKFYAGAMLGFLKDPANLASVGLGVAAAGKTLTGNFFRIGAAEGLISIGLDARQKSGEIERRKFLGEKVTREQALKEVGIDAGVSFVAGGIIGSMVAKFARLGRFTRRGTAGIDEAVVDKAAENIGKKVSPETEAASDIIDDVATIDGARPDGVTKEQHAAAVQKAAEDLEADRPVDTSKHFPDADKPGQAKIEPEEQAEFNTPEYREKVYNNVKAELEVEDVVVTRATEDGGEVTKSARQIIQELDEEERVIREVETCFKGGPAE